MDDSKTIIATTIGNPSGGQFNNPWPPGRPSEGERVAIFAFEVTSVDEEAESILTYHVAPVDMAREGPVTPEYSEPQGITVLWTGCGAGAVVRPATPRYDEWPHCEVRPDDMRFILMWAERRVVETDDGREPSERGRRPGRPVSRDTS